MQRFLQTQNSVMMTYLQTQAGLPVEQSTRPSSGLASGRADRRADAAIDVVANGATQRRAGQPTARRIAPVGTSRARGRPPTPYATVAPLRRSRSILRRRLRHTVSPAADPPERRW